MERSIVSRAAISIVALGALDGGTSLASTKVIPNYAAEPEYTINYSLSAINAAAAFTRGYTGGNQTVAVLDSGGNFTNPDLANKFSSKSWDFLTNTPLASGDYLGHGTFVAGIIAGARNGSGMEGVAFSANILAEKIIDDSGAVAVNDATLARAISYPIYQGVRIFNNSWNSSTMITQVSAPMVLSAFPSSVLAWESAVSKGALFVFAAGNSGTSDVGFLAGLPALFPSLQSGWIAAVATDSSGQIASYSNRCGVSAAWCMAAPGTNIISAYQGGLGIGSGTSFAAPQIAGAAADLKQEFPYLTAAQIGQILLKTANKTGIYANSAIYGQGLLDLNAATQPVGQVTVPTGATVSGSSLALGRSGALLSGAFGGTFARSVGPVLVLDEFQRGYQVDGSALVRASAAPFDTKALLDRFGDEDPVEIAPGVRAMFRDGDVASPATGTRMRIEMTGANGRSFEAGWGIDPALGFGSFASGTLPADALVVEDGLGNPYLNLAEGGPSMRMMLPLSSRAAGPTLAFGLFEGYSRSVALDARLGDPSYVPPRVYGWVAEAAAPIPSLSGRLALEAGTVMEQGAFLGSTVGGAFGRDGDTPTSFVGINGEVGLMKGLALVGAYHVGQSDIGSAGGFVTHYGTVRSESFALGLVASNVANKGDHAGLSMSQPLRVAGGTATLSVPFARDFAGDILTHEVNAPLAADGHETDLQGFYAGHLTSELKFDAGVLARFEPDNQRGAPTEMIGLFKLKTNF